MDKTKITFLSANMPLTKSYTLDSNNNVLDHTPYPLTSEFTSHEEYITDINDLYVQLVAHSNVGHCFLKGNLQRRITRESRAGLTAADTTQILLLDWDGLDLRSNTIDAILGLLGLGDTDYILQYSSGYGIKQGFHAHIFLLLDKPETPESLKLWLKWKNLSVPILRDQLRLTKSGMSVHWVLDTTVCQNDKLIYIAPPIIVGGSNLITDRTYLKQGTKRSVTLQCPPTTVETDSVEIVRQLRASAGLPEHKLTVKYFARDRAEILADPDRAAITGVKRNNGFTYVNLNGGDSWGYYHLTDKPELLYNFKGEPVYRLRELAPEYYNEAKSYAKTLTYDAHKPDAKSDKVQKFIINERSQGRYFKVVYDPKTGVRLDPAPTFKHIEDWCVMNHVPIPEAIDDWDIIFNPTTLETINTTNKTINIYKPTVYKLKSLSSVERTGEKATPIPAEYMQLVTYVCGNDETAANRLINWIAYIWQTGKKPKTAWVLHGVFGTGKGRLQVILDKLFGEHCVVTSAASINEHFNAAIATAQVLWIDEVTTDSWDNNKVTPKLRNWITEDKIVLRAMRKDAISVDSYMGVIFAANEHYPVEVRFGDRRYNIAPRQEVPIERMSWATEDLLSEDHGWLYQPENLQTLANALEDYKVDVALVRKPMDNAAKQAVMQVTQDLPSDIVDALHRGDTGFFIEYAYSDSVLPNIELTEYRQVIAKMMVGGRVALSTKEIYSLFVFLCGWKQPAGKFIKAAARYGLMLSRKTAREGGKIFAGTYFNFNTTDADRVAWSNVLPSELKVVRAVNEKE